MVFEDPLVAHAFGVAVLALDGLMRRDGEPRLLHAAATAGILADMGLDPETVAAGLLHEVCIHESMHLLTTLQSWHAFHPRKVRSAPYMAYNLPPYHSGHYQADHIPGSLSL